MSKFYGATALTGGGIGALDDINGVYLAAGDVAMVKTTTGKVYEYTLDADSGLTESSPYIITPDANAGTKRWVLSSLGSKYYVNAAAADQGVDTERSIKNLVDLIGTSKKATLILTHGGASNTTTYTLTTSETIPSNITLEIEPGAIIDGAGTLTIESPEHIKAGKRQKIFGTSITVAFTIDGIGYPHWWGALGDGSTNDAVALQSAITSCSLDISKGTFVTGSMLTISNNNRKIIGNGTIKLADSVDVGVFYVTGDNVTFDGITIDGNRANNTATSNGIFGYGADGLTVKNCTVHDFVLIGIVVKGGDNTLISNNTVYDCVFQHILVNSDTGNGTNVSVTNNNVYVTAFGINTSNGGISVYATASNTINKVAISDNRVDFPISTSAPVYQVLINTSNAVYDFVISNNVTRGGRIGISSTGSHRGTIVGNVVYQPYQLGIELATGGAYETDHITVANNTVTGSDSGGTLVTKGVAIYSATASSLVKHIVISGNIVKDCYYPIQVVEASSGDVEDVVIVNNHVSIPSTNGRIDIALVENLTVRGNHIDLNGQTTARGIYLIDCDNFIVEDNYIFGGIAGTHGVYLRGSSVDITFGTVKNNSYNGAGTAVYLYEYIRYTGDSNTTDITGTLEISNNVGQIPFAFNSDDGNPSAAFSDFITLSGTSTVTDFLHDYIGKKLIIKSLSTPTIEDNAAIFLDGGVDYVMTGADTLVLKCFAAGVWSEISRSVN